MAFTFPKFNTALSNVKTAVQSAASAYAASNPVVPKVTETPKPELYSAPVKAVSDNDLLASSNIDKIISNTTAKTTAPVGSIYIPPMLPTKTVEATATPAKPGEFGMLGNKEVISGLDESNPLFGKTKEEILSGHIGPDLQTKMTGEQQTAADALTRFLENPALYQGAVDSSGRTAWDLARQQTAASSQADRDRTIEALRGNLAARGITGPAAEQMINEAMVQSDISKAQAMTAITGQELAAKDAFAQEAILKAAGISSDIYSQGQDIMSKERMLASELANKTSLTKLQGDIDANLQGLRNQGAMDLQTQAQSFETENKAKMDAGFNLGSSDRLQGMQKTDEELVALGYDQNQIWAYKSGFSGQTAEDFTALRDNVSKLLFAQIIGAEGDISSVEIQGMIDSLGGLYSGQGTTSTENSIYNPIGLGDPRKLDDSQSGLSNPYLPGDQTKWSKANDNTWVYDTGDNNLVLRYDSTTGTVIGSDGNPYVINDDGTYYLAIQPSGSTTSRYERSR